MQDPKSVLITGASSGIGAALAEAYASQNTHLALCGRNAARLERITENCRSRGATVTAAVLDVTDQEAVRLWLETVHGETPLELVVANAGVSGGTASGEETADEARLIFRTNIDGVLNTIHPAAELMRGQGSGQIAIVSSLAGFRGFPGAPAYSASKAMVRVYGEALRGALSPYGIGVSVVCPGFVKSRITDKNQFPMPMLMEADRAALIIRTGLARNKPRIAFPWPIYLVAWLMGAIPPRLIEPLMARLPKKG